LGQEHRRAYDAGFTGNFNYLGYCGGRYLYSTHHQPEGAEASAGAVETENIGQNAIGYGRIHRVPVGSRRLSATLARRPRHLPLPRRGARCVVLAALLGCPGISPPIGTNKEVAIKKFIIKDFQLKGGQVQLAVSLLGQEKSLVTQLPDIHLTDIGEKKGGIKPKEAFRLIFAELSKHIKSPDVMRVLGEQLKELKLDPKLLEGRIPEDVPEDIKDVGDKLKNLFGQ